MQSWDFYMTEALKEAEKALIGGDVPIGAVMVCQGEIIARAHNKREKDQAPTAHAEIIVIEQAAQKLKTRRLRDCTLYVTLEPCPMCAGALVISQVEMCVFGAFDSRQGCCGSIYNIAEDPAFYHHTKIIGGVKEEACQKLLQGFFQKKRRGENPCP